MEIEQHNEENSRLVVSDNTPIMIHVQQMNYLTSVEYKLYRDYNIPPYDERFNIHPKNMNVPVNKFVMFALRYRYWNDRSYPGVWLDFLKEGNAIDPKPYEFMYVLKGVNNNQGNFIEFFQESLPNDKIYVIVGLKFKMKGRFVIKFVSTKGIESGSIAVNVIYDEDAV
jgi:hypothetical protein